MNFDPPICVLARVLKFRPIAATTVFGLACLLLSPAAGQDSTPPSSDPTRALLVVEALLRLETKDLSSNAKLKQTVDRVLEQVRGTDAFVELVKHFDVPGQGERLLEVASGTGSDEASASALRLLLVRNEVELIRQKLTGTNTLAAVRIAKALGNAGDGQSIGLLLPLLKDFSRDLGLRKQAVKSLVRYQEGASQVVTLGASDQLPTDLRFTAGVELSTVRWPEVKMAASKAFPPLETGGAEPLPPIAQLMRKTGDPKQGAALFAGKATCAACHQVAGQGINFGPDLSQVGVKLGKDALYEAILDPSSGISFGYEAWLFTLKSGDEAFGLIASETETDLSVRAAGGVVTVYKKEEVSKREKQSLSVMPAGLQATMTPQELVDLVEYLSSLRAQNN